MDLCVANLSYSNCVNEHVCHGAKWHQYDNYANLGTLPPYMYMCSIHVHLHVHVTGMCMYMLLYITLAFHIQCT